MKRLLGIVLVVLLFPKIQAAEISLQKTTTVRILDKTEAAKTLVTADAFTMRMSRFDRSARMQTDRQVSEKELLEFAAGQAISFSDTQKQELREVFGAIDKKIAGLKLKLMLPPVITVIQTTGKEEGGAAYCRGNSIILPKNVVEGGQEIIQDYITHELFHILTSQNPELRRELYAIVGFVPCKEVRLSDELLSRKITNPDAFKNDFRIEISLEGRSVSAIPILLSSSEKYDVKRGGTFFEYIEFKLLVIEEQKGEWVPKREGGKAKLLNPLRTPGYMEKIGGNTEYVIHPEEVLADNFRLMLDQATGLPTPLIPEKMKELLSK